MYLSLEKNTDLFCCFHKNNFSFVKDRQIRGLSNAITLSVKMLVKGKFAFSIFSLTFIIIIF